MDEELKKILQSAVKNGEENRKDLVEMKKMIKSIKNHFIRQEIFSLVRFLIIIVPLAIGAIYLMPHMGRAMDQYKQLMNFSVQLGSGKADIKDIEKYLTPDLLDRLDLKLPSKE